MEVMQRRRTEQQCPEAARPTGEARIRSRVCASYTDLLRRLPWFVALDRLTTQEADGVHCSGAWREGDAPR